VADGEKERPLLAHRPVGSDGSGAGRAQFEAGARWQAGPLVCAPSPALGAPVSVRLLIDHCLRSMDNHPSVREIRSVRGQATPSGTRVRLQQVPFAQAGHSCSGYSFGRAMGACPWLWLGRGVAPLNLPAPVALETPVDSQGFAPAPSRAGRGRRAHGGKAVGLGRAGRALPLRAAAS